MNVELLTRPMINQQPAVDHQFNSIMAANNMQEHMAAQNPFGLPTETVRPNLSEAVASSFDVLNRVTLPVAAATGRIALEKAGISQETARQWRVTAQEQFEAQRLVAPAAYIAGEQANIRRATEAYLSDSEDDEESDK